MNRAGTRSRAAALLALLLTAGCGGAPVCNSRVEGTVRLDGVPLGGVRVEFVPDVASGVAAPSSSALTDENGHFRLTFGDDRPGAVVGRHRVVVIVGRGEARPRGVKVPLVYAIAAQTPLRVEVTPDGHTYDVALSRNPQAAP
ncbi:MAG TPA: hypothetical protein VJ739_19865 [Gemmataceae bacterium]|nr:hypothetical protein [Gemmataceae bacterium]